MMVPWRFTQVAPSDIGCMVPIRPTADEQLQDDGECMSVQRHSKYCKLLNITKLVSLNIVAQIGPIDLNHLRGLAVWFMELYGSHLILYMLALFTATIPCLTSLVSLFACSR